MKQNLIHFLLILFSLHSFGQGTSIHADTVYRAQTLRTYITGPTGVFSSTTVSVPQLNLEKQFILYPNPSDGNMYLLLNNTDKKKYTLTVNDLLGRTVKEQIVQTGEEPVKMHLDLVPGIYSYRLNSYSGDSSFTGMFIIQ